MALYSDLPVYKSTSSGINLFDSFDNFIFGVWGEAPIVKDLTIKGKLTISSNLWIFRSSSVQQWALC